MALSERLHIETGSQIFKMASPNRKYLYFSFYARWQKIPTAICMFWGLENTVALLAMLYLETGSEKFKMVTAKPEVHVSQLQYKIAKIFILFSGSGNSMALSKSSMSKRK
jgi:hypothetical protein